jgi:hypothetical protein
MGPIAQALPIAVEQHQALPTLSIALGLGIVKLWPLPMVLGLDMP